MIESTPSQEYQALLEKSLFQWSLRRRLVESPSWGLRGLTGGLAIAVLIALLARAKPLLTIPWLLALAGIWGALGLLCAILLVWLWPREQVTQARYFDRQLALKERFSTAFEIAQGKLDPPDWLARRQLMDAVQRAQQVDLAAGIPLRIARRDWLPAVIALVLLATAIWIPNSMQDILAERAAVRQVIEQEVEALDAVRQEVASDPQLSPEDRQAMLDILDGTIERLAQQDLSSPEALAELTAASERLRELADNSALERAAELSQAAASLADSALTQPLAKALASGDLALAAAILQDFADDAGERLTREQELDLAEQLAEAAAELADSNPELAEQLAEAASAIQDGNTQAARQALAQAAQMTSQTGQQAAAAQAAQQAANQFAQSGQQVAQAGSGAAGAGQSNQAGNTGQSSGGAGRGEGNGESTGGQASQMPNNNGPGDGGLRQFESIYAPQRLGGDGGPSVQLPQGGDPGELIRELESSPEMGQSSVPYNQVYAEYQDAANQALNDQRIPLGLKGYVRDYFSSLEP